MTRLRGVSWGLPALLALPILFACGKKGPPLPPLRLAPARIEDLSARRLGSDVHLQFTIPTKNVDGSTPADLTRVEVYGYTGAPVDSAGTALNAREFRRFARLVGTIDVKPPPSEKEAAEQPSPAGQPSQPADERPTQGAVATLVEHLTAEVSVATEPPQAARGRKAVVVPPSSSVLLGAIAEAPIVNRIYAAYGVNHRNDPGPPSARVAIPLGPTPPAPTTPSVRYTETAITLEWNVLPRSQKPVQEEASGGMLESTPVFGQLSAYAYNVYEVPSGSKETQQAWQPLNSAPLRQPSYEDARLEFGSERCYAVRTVELVGRMRVESDASSAVCVAPVDTFPPQAPKGLAAVASEGAISLIWEPNSDKDLAGYLVLRGESPDPNAVAAPGAPGVKLQLLLQSPIRETTYRDATTQPGVRYVYAVIAVDSANPPNASPESNRAEEAAR